MDDYNLRDSLYSSRETPEETQEMQDELLAS